MLTVLVVTLVSAYGMVARREWAAETELAALHCLCVVCDARRSTCAQTAAAAVRPNQNQMPMPNVNANREARGLRLPLRLICRLNSYWPGVQTTRPQ